VVEDLSRQGEKEEPMSAEEEGKKEDQLDGLHPRFRAT
jgi:hypothetical protein